MAILRYEANFPLKYGDMCIRHYKTLAIARREVTKAYKRFQAPESFYATIHSFEVGNAYRTKKLIEEIWI